MTTRRSKPRADARPLPTSRVKADLQLAAVLAFARQHSASTAKQICGEVGIDPNRLALAFAWLVSLGLIERTDQRGLYRATFAAGKVAAAYAVDEEHGRAALRNYLDTTWFASVAARRLAERHGERVDLATDLIRAAGCADDRRPEVEILVDWLELAGIVEIKDGWVTWCDPAAPTHGEELDIEDITTSSGPPTLTVEDQNAEGDGTPVPSPRAPEPESNAPPLNDFRELMTNQWSFDDLLALPPERLADIQTRARELAVALRSLPREPDLSHQQ